CSPPSSRRSTANTPKNAIGLERGLQPDWLNDAAKGFLPGPNDRRQTVFESESLPVQVPSPEYLLAMKLHASRDERDPQDPDGRPDCCSVPQGHEAPGLGAARAIPPGRPPSRPSNPAQKRACRHFGARFGAGPGVARGLIRPGRVGFHASQPARLNG
ncbi:MAG: hypothetical protein LBD77_06245, partial [Bifidobacteriaceae bacterium]|nr:hypothetical protein [Bifidobacteriaceae bacterium]